MKPLKKKLSSTEWLRKKMKRYNYGKYLKTSVFERRKQKNIHGNKN